MTVQTVDGLVSALPGQRFNLYMASMTSKAAASFQSLWKAAGTPGGGATPGSTTGVYPASGTSGGLTFTNPAGGKTTYLAKLAMAGSVIGTLIIYDRLWTNSGLSGALNTSQTFTAPTLTRPDALGTSTELWLEVYTATGATPATATATYTNSLNVSSRSATATLIASPVAGQMIPFILQAGDAGVRTVGPIILSVSTGTAGDFGLTILRRIAEIPLTLANVSTYMDGFALGLPSVDDSSCLAFMVQCSTTTTGNILGSLSLAQG